MARRGSDLRTVPLCADHHLFGSEAIHRLGRSNFERRFNLDCEAIVARLNREYLETQPVFGHPKPWPKISVEEWPGLAEA